MKYSFIILFLLSSLSGYTQERYNFLNLSLENGLSQITVTSIYQDKKGFMWFGTRNGLNKYDGYSFDVFRNNIEKDRSLSDNHILCIDGDDDNNLWIGTNNGLNKLNLATNQITRFTNNPKDSFSLSHNMIPSIHIDDNNNIWIGTNSGLNLYNKNDNTFTRIEVNGILTNNPINKIIRRNDIIFIATQNKGIVIYNHKTKEYKVLNSDNGLPDNFIKTIYIDHDENLWIGTRNNGVAFQKKNEDTLTFFNSKNGLTNNYIRCIAESPEGNILIGTFNGLNTINPVTGDIIQHNTDDYKQGGLSHYSIYSILFDKSRTLWVGTYAGGINFYNPYGQKFRFYNPNEGKATKGIIGPMQESGDYLYIASEGAGLIEMNKKDGTYNHYKLLDDLESAYGLNILKSLYREGNKLLCGTNRGTIYSFDINSKKITLFHDFKKEHSIYHISKNSQGDFLIGGVNEIGFCIIKQGGGVRKEFPVKGKGSVSFGDVRCLYEVSRGEYLIGTRNNGLFHYNSENKELMNYKNDPAKENGTQISGNYISSIFKDSKGRFWIGIYGGGICLYDTRSGTFKTYSTEQGLDDDNICAIVEDNNFHLWISTLSGISDFDMGTGTFKNYTHSNGIDINEFTPHAGINLSGNLIAFSGNNGFITFAPRQMSINPYVPPIILKNLFIDNKLVVPDATSTFLTQQPDELQELTLQYNQSNIAIEFSALNYIFPNKNQYAYMLQGFDNTWNEVGSRRTAYYTNIPPGKYKFIVRGSNNDGIWNDEGKSLQITVLPPLWKTWWAYCLYVFLLAGIIFIIIRYFNQKKWLENEVKLKQAENKAREEFHQARNSLFTNFSHELRTPLTLILSPLEDMMVYNENLPEKVKENHTLMHSNAQRLLRLVNNLMDFQKKESGTMNLRVSENNFIKFSEDMVYLFNELAISRNIKLEFKHNVDNIDYWFDKNLMEKVYFNFLSNAFKNTPDNGFITVSVSIHSYTGLLDCAPQKVKKLQDEKLEYIYIEIKDSGIGLEKSELENIFIPFYQVAQNEHSNSSTGLGLSLSRSIIEMHRGIIWAESPQKNGAVFKIILPVDKSYFGDNEIINDIISDDNEEHTYCIEKTERKTEIQQKTEKKYTILTVEDNPDVRKYIMSHLSGDYNIIEALNGKEALDKAFNMLPDLIISDLMMPKMDGMEMTSVLKNDMRTSHIPIIMLTARTMPEDITVGYETGADDYITKPFNSQVLKARVENILKSRENLKDIYSKRFTLETLGVKTTSADDKFIQKLYQILEKELSNPQFNQDSLSQEIGMSKATLYRKIKAITNLSPTEFVRNYRLEMGAKLLKEAQFPVSEVYVAVGFNSHTYFSTSFKALYGISPSEYINHDLKNE